MHRKSENRSSTLGECIRMERKKAGLTQAQLGTLIGLKESRVSKIENGAPITPETASFILEKMGSELQFNVKNHADDCKTAIFQMGVVYHFSKEKGLTLSRAFNYLKTFKGLDYLNRFREIEQTLSYPDIVNNLSRVCSNNGGAL